MAIRKRFRWGSELENEKACYELRINTKGMPQASFSDLINGEKPTFVDFSAEWCGPCKMMAPILAELKSEVGDMIRIIKIDVDKNPQVASAYQVQSVPTLMLFRGGNVVWRQSGVIPTEHLKRAILQYA